METCNAHIAAYIEKNQALFTAVSDRIWAYAEPGMKETQSADYLEKTLREGGFTLTSGLAGIPTAFMGEWGSGKPIIGFLGEFDALPGLSQKGGCAQKSPLTTENGSYGHGCGHHLLGAGALAAAFALKDYLEQQQCSGTVRYYGCPGEEYGSGKTFMAREGCFDDADACITWHPGDHNEIVARGSLACYSVFFRFHGKTAHAAGSPHLGRSALDACELMNVGVNYLREHVIPEARMHYAYTDVGGIAPNVVQDHAGLHYFIRAPRVADMMDIVARVQDIAKGAALMSGTTLECVVHEALSDFLPNDALNTVMQRALQTIGAPIYDAADLQEAERFAPTVTAEERKNSEKNWGILTDGAKLPEGLLNSEIPKLKNHGSASSGSTDVGDTSYCTPTAQLNMATNIIGTPGHTWQITAQGTTSYAHKGMLQAAKVMALAAVYAMEEPVLQQAKAELQEKNGGGYRCPLPNGLKPTL